MKLEVIRKDDNEKIIEQQSKLTFHGIQKSFTIQDSYTFKQYEVLMKKIVYLSFTVLEQSNFLLYETYCDDLQPYSGYDLYHYNIWILVVSY